MTAEQADALRRKIRQIKAVSKRRIKRHIKNYGLYQARAEFVRFSRRERIRRFVKNLEVTR